MIVATAHQPDAKGQQRGAQQRRRRDDAHVEWRESECRQIDRQQNGDEPITEIAQCARPQQMCYGGGLHVTRANVGSLFGRQVRRLVAQTATPTSAGELGASTIP